MRFAKGSRKPILFSLVPSVLLLWFIGAFLYGPLLVVLQRAFLPSGEPSLEAFARLAGSDRVVRALMNTITVTAISVITVNLVGIAQVVLLEFVKIRGSRILTMVYALPLVFGSVSAVTGYMYVYGEKGLLTYGLLQVLPQLPSNWFTGIGAVVFIHSFSLTGYHFLFLRTAIRGIDFSTVEAARSLGQSPIKALIGVVVPVLTPTLFAVTLMVLMSSLNSFAAPYIAGGPGFSLLTQLIRDLTSLGRLDLSATLAFVLGVVSLGMFAWMQAVERKGKYLSVSKSPTPIVKIRLSGSANVIAHFVAWALALVNLLPVLATLIYSFAPVADVRQSRLPTSLTLDNYTRVFTSPTIFEPLFNSILLALIAVSLALVVSLTAAVLIQRLPGRATDFLEFSLFLPWIFPGILLAVGLIALYDHATPWAFGQVLVGSYWLLPLGYVLIILPVMVRMIGASLKGLDPSLLEAARVLGVPAWQNFLRITLPITAPVILQVVALSFNDLLGEYVMSVMLYNVNNKPLGVAVAEAAISLEPNALADSTVYVIFVLLVSLVITLGADQVAKSVGRRTSKPLD